MGKENIEKNIWTTKRGSVPINRQWICIENWILSQNLEKEDNNGWDIRKECQK
jgi:hypothetical protein